jgi:hypothetical protein
MKSLIRHKKLLGLALAVALVTIAVVLPASASVGVCCGITGHYIYFSDATHRTIVGTCTINGCTGETVCSGSVTQFYIEKGTCCSDTCGE